MPPAVHLLPDRLRVHAAEAADLAAGLRSALDDRPDAHAPGLDRLETTLRRALRELGELEAVLRSAAGTAEQADAEAARTLHRIARS